MVGKDVTLVADRNRLYYGKTDPAYITAENAANANTRKNRVKAKRVTAKQARTKKAAKQAQDNLNVLESVALKLEAMVVKFLRIKEHDYTKPSWSY